MLHVCVFSATDLACVYVRVCVTQAREEEIEEANNKRVEERKTHMLQQKAPQFAAIQANRIKTMRQLIEARKYVERHRKLIKPTIVEKYANFGSTTYAPVQREGRFPEVGGWVTHTGMVGPRTDACFLGNWSALHMYCYCMQPWTGLATAHSCVTTCA